MSSNFQIYTQFNWLLINWCWSRGWDIIFPWFYHPQNNQIIEMFEKLLDSNLAVVPPAPIVFDLFQSKCNPTSSNYVKRAQMVIQEQNVWTIFDRSNKLIVVLKISRDGSIGREGHRPKRSGRACFHSPCFFFSKIQWLSETWSSQLLHLRVRTV